MADEVTETQVELEPCRCGSRNLGIEMRQLGKVYRFGTNRFYDNRPVYRSHGQMLAVKCHRCGMEGQETKRGKQHAIELWNDDQVGFEPCGRCGSSDIRIIEEPFEGVNYSKIFYGRCIRCRKEGPACLLGKDVAKWFWNEEQRKFMEETESTTLIQQRNEDGSSRITERHDTISTGQESSVEITQNANGKPRITVKSYHADIAEAKRLALEAYREMVRELGESQ